MGLMSPNTARTVADARSEAAAARLVPASEGAEDGAQMGPQVALQVLESTMIGAPVSAKTNQLIDKQLMGQPANANPTDTLNLLTALVLGWLVVDTLLRARRWRILAERKKPPGGKDGR